MDLNLVRTFLVVAECQSYTKAAERMQLTQPAISAAIKRLEKLYGENLFIKQGRGIELSSKGQQLIPAFRQAVSIIENAMNMRKQFNVYCNESLINTLFPIDNINLQESPPEKNQLFEHLRQEKTDIIVDSMLTRDSAFMVEEILLEPLVVICRKDHPRIQQSITKDAFYREEHVFYSGTWEKIRGFELFANEPIEERKMALICHSIASIALNISQSNSIAVIARSFAEQWAAKLNLQILTCPINTDLIPYHLVYHKRQIKNPLHKKIREEIKAKIKALYRQ
ncbi:LysR family transcriptional regulator [Shewanella mangrovisoli]|uniref:LysR family transcriptional regulator n=1 Tax=Shewanella mangrovisoli TaxID=2864211 RepID=UPI0035B753FF